MEISIYDQNTLEIISKLNVDQYNRPLKTIPNYITIFENDKNLKDLLRFNELTNSPENSRSGNAWNDEDDSLVRAYIEQNYNLRNKDCYADSFNIICHKNKYNPIKKLIESKKWDGVPRISSLLQKYLKCDDTLYTKEVARLIFAGGIARLYDNGCKFDFMPIFKGKQGAGKSTFIRWLALNDSWFKEVNEIDGQQGREAVEGAWICEISELLALTKSKEVEAVKSFITRQNDAYRKPYEKRTTDNYRKCIFIGTTNKTQFLTDKTGNRRFLPVEAKLDGYELFDRQVECKEDILQCWLEAKYNYDNKNYSLVVSKDILDQIKVEQEAVVEDDWRVGVIGKYLENKDRVCVKDIWDNAFDFQEKLITKKDSNDIVSIIDNNFSEEWEKSSSIRFAEYGRQRGWMKKFKITKPNSIVDDKDLPF